MTRECDRIRVECVSHLHRESLGGAETTSGNIATTEHIASNNNNVSNSQFAADCVVAIV